MNKKIVLAVLLVLPVLLFGCTNKMKEKEVICKKDLKYQDNGITWINEVSLKYDVNDEVTNATIKEFITVNSSISEERRASFKDQVEKECTSELGSKFDSCTIETLQDQFTITFSTNKLDVLNSAIASSDNQTLDTDSKKDGVTKYLVNNGYVCEEVK